MRFLLFCFVILAGSCPGSIPEPKWNSSFAKPGFESELGNSNKLADEYWRGQIGLTNYVWTKDDLILSSGGSNSPFFSFISKQDFDEFIKEEGGTGISGSILYEFKLNSVVGNIVGYEKRTDYLFGIFQGYRAYQTARISDKDYAKGKIKPLKLTDLFSEKEILDKLLKSSEIKSVFEEEKTKPPTTLGQLILFFKKRDFRLNNGRFDLSSNFISEFVIYGVEQNEVIIRLSIHPNSTADRRTEAFIELKFKLPQTIKNTDTFFAKQLRLPEDAFTEFEYTFGTTNK